MLFLEIIKVVIVSIVEGITEWLPISSTGHLILLNEFLKLNVSAEFLEMFLVVIQLGAIMAVPVLFFERLNPFGSRRSTDDKSRVYRIWSKVIVGSIPAAVFGVLLDDLLDAYLYNYIVVAIALAVYGIAFIFVEKSRAEHKIRVNSIDELTYKDALKIGGFQSLSLIPGTSRSGSTILGSMLCGVSRETSAEFSFFMAIPIMLGASGLKVVKFLLSGINLDATELLILFVGIVVSFVVSLLVIRFLMNFVKLHDFKVFGYYRIALGLLVLFYFFIKTLF